MEIKPIWKQLLIAASLLLSPILAISSQKESNSQLTFSFVSNEASRDQEVQNLDLEALIEFAKQNSKLYQMAQQNIEIAQGELTTAGLWSNPQLSYSQSFIGGAPTSQAGSTEHAPGIALELDLFGKRGKRIEVAEKGLSFEKLSFSDFDRLFKLQLRLIYRQILLLSEQLKYKKEFFSTYLVLMEASKIRAEKGDVSGVEFDRLDLERIAYEADFRTTELQLLEISQKMRNLLGIPFSDSILALKGEFIFVPLEKLIGTQKTFQIERRPDLAAILTKGDQAEALASLKRREVFPSLNLGGEYRIKGNEGYFGFSISLPLPLFNRNQGEIIKAEETAKKVRIEAEAKKKEITFEVRTRLKELLILEQMLQKYQDLGLLEKNKTVAERSRYAYLKKAYSIVALLESQRNYINVQSSYFEQLFHYYTSIDAYLAAATEGA